MRFIGIGSQCVQKGRRAFGRGFPKQSCKGCPISTMAFSGGAKAAEQMNLQTGCPLS